MGEVEFGLKFAGDALMLGELLAIVGRQGMNTGRERRQQRDHCVRDRLRRLERHVSNQRVAGLAFVERDQCLLLASANDQVGLPVTEALACIDDGWALINREPGWG